MPRHAGFAAVVGLDTAALDGLAGALYHAGKITRVLDATSFALGNIPSVRFDHVFLDPPTFALQTSLQRQGAAPGHPAVGLRLVGRGPVTITPSGRPAETKDSDVEFLVTMEARAMLLNAKLALLTEPTSAKLETFTVTAFPGTSFDPQNESDLGRADVRALLEIGFKVVLAAIGSLFPPLDVSFLGAVAAQPTSKATLGVVDGELLIGIDVNAPPVVTTGDVTQFTAITGADNIAMVTNPVAMSLSTGTLVGGLTKAAAEQGAAVQSLSLTLEEGDIAVAGAVGNDVGNVTFSMKAVPHILHFPDRSGGQVEISLQDVVVNVNPSWWISAPRCVHGRGGHHRHRLLHDVHPHQHRERDHLEPDEQRRGGPPHLHDPGRDRAGDRDRVSHRVECHTDRFDVGMQLEVEHHKPKLVGPESVSADDIPTFNDRPVRFAVELGTAVEQDDPYLRLRWTIFDGSGQYLGSTDDLPTNRPGGLEIRFTQIGLPWLTVANYRIGCRLYRAKGSASEELLQDTRGFRCDRPARPITPVRPMDPSGPGPDGHDASRRVAHDPRDQDRHSPLEAASHGHPWSLRERSHYSQTWLDGPTKINGPVLEYLDALPFARADLVAQRGQVCD